MAATVAETPTSVETSTAADELPATSSNVLLISLKRSRFFYERAAKELLASGRGTVEISALGDAICTAVELAAALEDKKSATITKIETKYQSRPFPRAGRKGVGESPVSPNVASTTTEGEEPLDTTGTTGEDAPSPSLREGESIKTAGIHIILKKHPDFKGSRITPAHVTWCPANEDGSASAIFNDVVPADSFAASVGGNASLQLSGTAQATEVAGLLTSAAAGNHDVGSYQAAHQLAIDAAWRAVANLRAEGNAGGPLRLTEITEDMMVSKDLKAVYCRPCITLHCAPDEGDLSPTTGAIFIDVFADDKMPFTHDKNCAIVYIAAPAVSDYPDKANFLSAVQQTGANLMTALCDFNGMVRRDEKTTSGIRRLVTVGINLFSADKGSIHPDVTKLDVAKEILQGLSSEFHYGASPRLNFAFDDDVFKHAWIDQTGLEVADKPETTTA